MKRGLIALNGVVTCYEQMASMLEAFGEGEVPLCVVGVDGGARHLEVLGVTPDVLVGDFDSIGDLKRYLEKWPDTDRRVYPSEKDFTDAELALEVVLSRGVDEIVFIGAFGGRLDHMMANVLLMRRVPKGVKVYALDETNIMRWVSAPFFESGVVQPYMAHYVSLVPVVSAFEGIDLEGFKYPLKKATIEVGQSVGISNECTGATYSIRIASGEGLLIFSKECDCPVNVNL
ncbi:thiamine diphosphokinase [Fusibacter sp. JL298sf-3]